MGRYVSFGEIMLRLKSPGREKLLQSPLLEATFGGGEANVAVGLARFKLDSAFVTALPEGPLGDACIMELRKLGVDTSLIIRKGKRLGIYFLEAGSNQRPSKVIYDRSGSAVTEIAMGDIDWGQVFKGTSWFHITGITPALSQTLADLSLEAAASARSAGASVSCDLNFRSALWKYGRPAPEVMGELVKLADILIGNEEDYQKSLGIETTLDVEKGLLSLESYRPLTDRALARYTNLRKAAVSLRESRSADDNGWQAVLNTGKEFIVSTKYQIGSIVDRVGSGDAFAAGLIYGLTKLKDDREALELAAAAGCLKHTVPGDFPLFTFEEVQALCAGKASGRIQR